MKECLLYKKLGDCKVKCLSCKHYCTIADGKYGICGVRKNKKGKLYLEVYGKPIAVAIDPIEKKPFRHFLQGTEVFSIGTIGCNFKCEFCQNSDISQVRQKNIRITEFSPSDIVDYCLKNKIPSIAYTYNEPTIFFEYTYDTAKLAHKKGIKNVYVSNGYYSKEAIDMIKPYLDAVNIDLKAFTNEFYEKICGAKLENVLDTIKYTHKLGIWIEVTTLLVPDENDSIEEITLIAKFIKSVDSGIPWHVSAFHPAYKMMNKRRTSYEIVEKAVEIGKKVGLKFVYG